MINTKVLYEQKAQAQLEDISTQVQRLRAQMTTAQADARLNLNERMVELNRNVNLAREQLNNFQQASHTSWPQLKLGIDSRLQHLQDELQQLNRTLV